MITSEKFEEYKKFHINNNNNNNNNQHNNRDLKKYINYLIKTNKQFLLKYHYRNSKIKREHFKFKRLNHKPTQRLTTLLHR